MNLNELTQRALAALDELHTREHEWLKHTKLAVEAKIAYGLAKGDMELAEANVLAGPEADRINGKNAEVREAQVLLALSGDKAWQQLKAAAATYSTTLAQAEAGIDESVQAMRSCRIALEFYTALINNLTATMTTKEATRG